MGFAEDYLQKEKDKSRFDYSVSNSYLDREEAFIESNKTIIDVKSCFDKLSEWKNKVGNIVNNNQNDRTKKFNTTDINKSFGGISKIKSEGFFREIAHRIFAAELKESNHQVKEGNDQYSPQYLITPTGAKINRVFIVGTLIEKENIGTASEFWRGRIVDPTGTFFVSAGQYQPEAAQVFAKTTLPEFIAVIGKPATYTTTEGKVLISIRAESIHVVDVAIRDKWVLETASHTMRRLENLYSNMPQAFKARMYYSTNVEQYKAMVTRVLLSMNGVDSLQKKEAEPLT